MNNFANAFSDIIILLKDKFNPADLEDSGEYITVYYNKNYLTFRQCDLVSHSKSDPPYKFQFLLGVQITNDEPVYYHYKLSPDLKNWWINNKKNYTTRQLVNLWTVELKYHIPIIEV